MAFAETLTDRVAEDVRLRRVLAITLALRMGIVVFVWLAFTLPTAPAWVVSHNPGFHLMLLAIFAGYIQFFRKVNDVTFPMRWVGWVNAAEIISVTALAWTTAGTASPAVILYLMLVMGAVFHGQTYYVLTVALGVIAAFGLLVLLLMTGAIPLPDAFIMGGRTSDEIVNAAFVSTTAALIGFFSLFTILLLIYLFRQIESQDNTQLLLRERLRDANQALLAGFHEMTAVVDRLKACESITEDARRQLLRLEKVASVGRLVVGNLHEMRGPLTLVLAELELLLLAASLPAEDRVKETLKKVLANASRMKALVQNIEDAIRPGDDKRFVEVDMNTLISRCVGLVSHEMSRRGVRLTAVYDPSEPRILGVPGQLEQVVFNLLQNSAEACDNTDGHVTVESQIRQTGVSVTVSDNGRGLSEAEIRRVFDPFYSVTDGFDRLGLGLYVAAAIVDRHRGHISVESAPGKRTVFQVTFPIAV